MATRVAIYARDMKSAQLGYVMSAASEQISVLQTQASLVTSSARRVYTDYLKAGDDRVGLRQLKDVVKAGQVDLILILCDAVIGDSEEEFNQFLATIHELDPHVVVRTYCPLSLQAVR